MRSRDGRRNAIWSPGCAPTRVSAARCCWMPAWPRSPTMTGSRLTSTDLVVGLETLRSFADLAGLAALGRVTFSLDLRNDVALVTEELKTEALSTEPEALARGAIGAGARAADSAGRRSRRARRGPEPGAACVAAAGAAPCHLAGRWRGERCGRSRCAGEISGAMACSSPRRCTGARSARSPERDQSPASAVR